MKLLADRLRDYILSGKLIGFCPWDDGEGMTWGRILDVTETRLRVHKIDHLGQFYEVKDYPLSDIISFNESEIYAERLELLVNFSPTLTTKVNKVTDQDEIRKVLESAAETGEVIRIDIPGDKNISATISAIDGAWLEFIYYHEPMIVGGTQWVRIDRMVAVNWRNANCESDIYLLNLGADH